jgi:putative ABC transport system substrate-binding protein
MRFIQLGRREFITLLGGAAATWPLGARAQQPGRIPTVGVLWHAGSAVEEGALFVALRQGFLDLGYVEGKTVVFDHTYASEQYERFDANAAGLVARNVDVMVAVTRPAAVAAQRATTTIPIVFTVVSDPAVHQGRSDRQSKDREGPRPQRPTGTARPRR